MTRTTLKRILTNHFFKYSMIPILVIEVSLLILYFGINYYITQKNTISLKDEVLYNTSEILKNQSNSIDSILCDISDIAIMMKKNHEYIFANSDIYNFKNPPKFTTAPNGVFYKTNEEGGSLYYSSQTKITQKEINKAIFTEAMDPFLQSIVESSPNIVAAYFNSYDDMNRLYPFIDKVYDQYGEHIHMEDYNFYYLADKKHNPDKKVAWTDAYLDPAGNGWMISAVVPIYKNDFLEGVSGIDFTIDKLVSNVLNAELPFDAKCF